MKLIYCNSCRDVVRLIVTRWRKCECGKSAGQYNIDFATATVAGDCRVIGIPNKFFDEVFQYLTDRGKQWYRDRNSGWGTTDCWYGEFPGDKQVFRIKSLNGPRIKLKVTKISKDKNRLTILDKRDYTVDGKRETEIITERWIPSFKPQKIRNKN